MCSHVCFKELQSEIVRCGDRGGHKLFETSLSPNNSSSVAIVEFAICAVALSSCNQHCRSVSSSNELLNQVLAALRSHALSEENRTNNSVNRIYTRHCRFFTVKGNPMVNFQTY